MGDRAGTENAALLAYRDGEIGAAEFLEVAARKLRYEARDLWFGWRKKLPAWVELEDIEQELRARVLQHVDKWDPTKSESIWDFCVWSAKHRTQRQIHKWRGATIHGNEGMNPGRPEVTFSRAFRVEDDKELGSRVEALMASHAKEEDPAQAIDRRRTLDDLLAEAQTVREAIILRALRDHDGEIERAIAAVNGDFEALSMLGTTSPSKVEKFFRAEITRVGNRVVRERPPVDLFEAA